MPEQTKLTDEQLSDKLLVEQLRRKGWTIETVKEKYGKSNAWLNDIRWDTEEEADDFAKWAIDMIVKRGQSRRNKSMAARAFAMWNLNIGLGIGPIQEEAQ